MIKGAQAKLLAELLDLLVANNYGQANRVAIEAKVAELLAL